MTDKHKNRGHLHSKTGVTGQIKTVHDAADAELARTTQALRASFNERYPDVLARDSDTPSAVDSVVRGSYLSPGAGSLDVCAVVMQPARHLLAYSVVARDIEALAETGLFAGNALVSVFYPMHDVARPALANAAQYLRAADLPKFSLRGQCLTAVGDGVHRRVASRIEYPLFNEAAASLRGAAPFLTVMADPIELPSLRLSQVQRLV